MSSLFNPTKEEVVCGTEKDAFGHNIVVKEEEVNIAVTEENVFGIKKEEDEGIYFQEEYVIKEEPFEVKSEDFNVKEENQPHGVKQEDVTVKEEEKHFRIPKVEEDVLGVKEIEEAEDPTVHNELRADWLVHNERSCGAKTKHGQQRGIQVGDTMERLGVEPYMFEPESEEESDVEEQPVSRRLEMMTSEWCTCGNCAHMPEERENICCREIPQVMRRMTQVPEEITCMIDHPGLDPVCLNMYSLQNAMNIYRADYGRLRIRGMERQCRHLACRMFVSWCWGFLGRSVRVVIPSCVALRIQREFSDASGQYVGFRPPLD